MSIRVMSLIWAQRGFLTFTEKGILIRMADYAADDGTSIYPSLTTIADETSLDRRSVIRTINSLKAKNILLKIGTHGPSKTSLYKINVDLLHMLLNKNSANERFEASVIPSLVTERHYPSDGMTPPLVTERHFASDGMTPDPSLIHQYDPSMIQLDRKFEVNLNFELGNQQTNFLPVNKLLINHSQSHDKKMIQETPQIAQSAISRIFAHWKEIMHRPRSLLDENRKSAIEKGLSMFCEHKLIKAITGCSKTPHNIGQNIYGQKYVGLHIIFKDADQIERFMQNAETPPTPQNLFESRSEKNLKAKGAQKEYRAELMSKLKSGEINARPIVPQITRS